MRRGVEVVYWEYQFVDPLKQTTQARHQFLCGVSIKPGNDKELQVLSISSPSDVVSVETWRETEETVSSNAFWLIESSTRTVQSGSVKIGGIRRFRRR